LAAARLGKATGGHRLENEGMTRDELGVLRIDFPDGADESQLEEISWDDWFDNSRRTGWRSSTRSTGSDQGDYGRLTTADTVVPFQVVPDFVTFVTV
jgi:hypothetical protein